MGEFYSKHESKFYDPLWYECIPLQRRIRLKWTPGVIWWRNVLLCWSLVKYLIGWVCEKDMVVLVFLIRLLMHCQLIGLHSAMHCVDDGPVLCSTVGFGSDFQHNAGERGIRGVVRTFTDEFPHVPPGDECNKRLHVYYTVLRRHVRPRDRKLHYI